MDATERAQLDVEVAETIGWVQTECDGEIGETSAGDPMCMKCDWIGDGWSELTHQAEMPRWSVSDRYALVAVDAMRNKHPHLLFSLEVAQWGARWQAIFWHPIAGKVRGTGDTRAEACCKAIVELARYFP